jgi:hypothetical protein
MNILCGVLSGVLIQLQSFAAMNFSIGLAEPLTCGLNAGVHKRSSLALIVSQGDSPTNWRNPHHLW